jgi:hypothetical protein
MNLIIPNPLGVLIGDINSCNTSGRTQPNGPRLSTAAGCKKAEQSHLREPYNARKLYFGARGNNAGHSHFPEEVWVCLHVFLGPRIVRFHGGGKVNVSALLTQ